MFRIAFNLFTDAHRRDAREHTRRVPLSPTDATTSPAADPARIAEGREQLDRVAALMLELPEKHRAVLSLVVESGLPHREVAAIVGISADNSRYYLAQARRRLLVALE